MKTITTKIQSLLIAAAMFSSVTFVGATGVRDYYTPQNPFYVSGYGGQCTSYVWGRVYEALGIQLPFRGSANTWWTGNKQFPVSTTTPAMGSIAVWAGDSINPNGHVAYVESVSGSNVTITEANISNFTNSNYGGGYDGSKVRTTAQMADRGNGVGRLLGYIILTQKVNHPPVIASVNGSSASGAINVSFSASDPDGDAMRYDAYLFRYNGSWQYSGLSKSGNVTGSTTTATFAASELSSLTNGTWCCVMVNVFDPKNTGVTNYSNVFVSTKAVAKTGTGNASIDNFVARNSWIGTSRGAPQTSGGWTYYTFGGGWLAIASGSKIVWYSANGGKWVVTGSW